MHNTFPHPRSLLLVARLQIICSFRFVLMKIGFRSGPLCASLFYVARSFFDYKDDAHICTSSQTHNTLLDTIPCSAELISTAYQPWKCFSLTANQPQPAYKPKNSLPNRAHKSTNYRVLTNNTNHLSLYQLWGVKI
jgi:hypothetical protein